MSEPLRTAVPTAGWLKVRFHSPQPSPAGRGRKAFSLTATEGVRRYPSLVDWLPLPAGEGRGARCSRDLLK